MDRRNFEITVKCATSLEDVLYLGKMQVHARVSIGSDPETEIRTPTDKHSHIDPSWNYLMRYTVGESMLKHHGVMLVIKLYCTRKLGDRYVGEVNMSMKELFDQALPHEGNAVVCYPVKRGSVPSQGMLHFSYRFGSCQHVDKLLSAEGFGDWAKRVI